LGTLNICTFSIICFPVVDGVHAFAGIHAIACIHANAGVPAVTGVIAVAGVSLMQASCNA
jgi:hypothetical protein